MKINQEIKEQRRSVASNASLKWVALLHVVCCGGGLLVFSLISAGTVIPLAFLAHAVPYMAIIGVVLAAGALLWFFQRRCSTCPWSSPKQSELSTDQMREKR
jgi:hypothetical protein